MNMRPWVRRTFMGIVGMSEWIWISDKAHQAHLVPLTEWKDGIISVPLCGMHMTEDYRIYPTTRPRCKLCQHRLWEIVGDMAIPLPDGIRRGR